MEHTSARAWRRERPSGSKPLRLQLDQLSQERQPGVRRLLRRTLYIVFSCSSTRLWFLPRLLIEWHEERTPSDRLFLRVAEISQGCSSKAEAAVLLDIPRIRRAMDPDALPSTIHWVTFIAPADSPRGISTGQRMTPTTSPTLERGGVFGKVWN